MNCTPEPKRRRQLTRDDEELDFEHETPEKRARFAPGAGGDTDIEDDDSDCDGEKKMKMAPRCSGADEDLPEPLSQTDNVQPRLPLSEYSTVVPPRGREKTIRDRIHGQIMFEPLLVSVMDTPEFQRLRKLKQLGACDYVYPGTVHTRFEHSLGVAHLAGVMIDTLRRKQPELNISKADVLCVKLAGLVHDLGHGPLSHMFETFVNRVRKARGLPGWHHEEGSRVLLRTLVVENQIDFREFFPVDAAETPDEQLNFVIALIEGLKPRAQWPCDIGRPCSKRFLFDIVANKRNGIDVDKLDYFHRDAASAMGVSSPLGCDIQRLFESARVLEVNGETEVCFEEKMALSLVEIYKIRAWMHKYVYQHHTANAIEAMVCDVLWHAKDIIEMRGSNDMPVKLAAAVDDPVAYAKLGDWVLDQIWASTDQRLAPAQALMGRIYRRELYEQVEPCYSLPVPVAATTAAASAASARSFLLRCEVEGCVADESPIEVHAASLKELEERLHLELCRCGRVPPPKAGMSLQLLTLDLFDDKWKPPLAFTDVPSRTRLRLRIVDRASVAAVVSPPKCGKDQFSEQAIIEQLLNIAAEQDPPVSLKADEFIVQFVVIDFGKDPHTKISCDPIQNTHFFNPKIDPRRAVSISTDRQSQLFMPRALSEKQVYVYSRINTQEAFDKIRGLVKLWRMSLLDSGCNEPAAVNNFAARAPASTKLRRSTTW